MNTLPRDTMESSEYEKKTVVIPGKTLQNLIASKFAGTVTIYDPNDQFVYWRVYLGDGKIHFATSGMGQTERLTYLLGRLFPKSRFSVPENLTQDYAYICKIWQSGKLSLQQVRQVLFKITQEAITQFLALPRAAVTVDRNIGLDPLLLVLSLRQVVIPLQPQIRSWVELRSELNSPFQRPYLEDMELIVNQSWLKLADYKFVENIIDLLYQKMTFYELAHHTKKDVLELATLFQPLIKVGGIQVFPYDQPADIPRLLVACIDDSKATQRIVKMTLEASGFDVIGITDPSQALSQFVRNRPELVLMDINMPEIDGYELCRMFKQSNLLKDIPVIMLTGRDGLLDRIRARMVGASDYIAKPFNPQELVKLVNSYLNTTVRSEFK